MTWVAAGVGSAALTMQVYSSIQGGNAASKAARDQQDAAEAYKKYVSDQQQKATDLIMNPSAIAAHSTALASQEATVQRQENLAKSIEPALIDAGKQTAALLQGKSAPVLANIQQQRQVQRSQFVDSLTSQLGPGAQTSTAGMQQLAQFDLQTSNLMNAAQQQYLDKVSNLSISGGATLSDTLSKASSSLDQISAGGPEAKAAEVIAQFTNPGAGAQQAGVNAAGGQEKGAQLKAQAMGQLGGALVTGAGIYAGQQAPGTPNTSPTSMPTDSSGFAQMTQPTLGSQFGGQPSYGLGVGSTGATNPFAASPGASPAGAGGGQAMYAAPSTTNAGPFASGYKGSAGFDNGGGNYGMTNIGKVPNYAAGTLGSSVAGGGY